MIGQLTVLMRMYSLLRCQISMSMLNHVHVLHCADHANNAPALSPFSRVWWRLESVLIAVQVCSLPFDPPAFSPAKLTVAYEADFAAAAALPPEGRRYTLTHNDLTGALLLTIGSQFSAPQLSGAY